MNIDIAVEHDRGPFNGMAEVTGSVRDSSGTAVAGATVTARAGEGGAPRAAKSNGDGQFTLAGLAPGDYDLRIASPGFRPAQRNVTLKARDRAVVTVMLSMGEVSEAVLVNGLGMGGGGIGFGRGGGFGGGVAGGVLGGIIGGVPMGARAVAAPMAMMEAKAMLLDRRDLNSATLVKKEKDSVSVGAGAPHVRSYFPEALYINPEIVTDRDGRASIVIPMADSITTWRMAMMASTVHGALGSGTGSLKVFQDFFVDLDLPVTLTQGDRVSIPVAAYNYTGQAGKVSLQLQQDDLVRAG